MTAKHNVDTRTVLAAINAARIDAVRIHDALDKLAAAIEPPQPQQSNISKRVLRAVSREFRVHQSLITHPTRMRDAANPRLAFYYIMLRLLDVNEAIIARDVNRCRASVNKGATSAKNLIDTDKTFRLHMNRICEQLKLTSTNSH